MGGETWLGEVSLFRPTTEGGLYPAAYSLLVYIGAYLLYERGIW